MDGTELQREASARADELPGACLEHPFGPEWDVYKVRGRVFMLLTALGGADGERDDLIVTLKAAPGDSRVLREAYPEISPGYHMNKRHWITVRAGGALDAEMLADLVTESYLLVVEKLPRGQRPVDPMQFGQRTDPAAAGAMDSGAGPAAGMIGDNVADRAAVHSQKSGQNH